MYCKSKLSLLTAFLVALFLVACQKNDSQHTNSLSLKEESKNYFDGELAGQQVGKTLGENNRLAFTFYADWAKAEEQRIKDYEVVIVPLVFRERQPFSWNEDKTQKNYLAEPFLAFYKNSVGKIVAEIVYKSPSNSSAKGSFDGNILVTDWSGTIKRSFRYNNGAPRKATISIKTSSPGVKTELSSCIVIDYYQDVYVGGVKMNTEYLYSKYACEDEGAGGGLGSGGTGSGDTGGGGGPDYSPVAPESTYSVDCSAISYRQTGTPNWQEAGIRNIRLQMVWVGDPGSGNQLPLTIYVPQVVAGLPLKYANGTAISPGVAASLTAQMIDLAKVFTYQEFEYAPYRPDDATITNYFRKKLNELMVAKGGTAGVAGSKSPSIIFNDEKRTGWFPYDCK
ncbi:hypothetical protein SAMN04488128_103744 [Chitinophaga eiseniae]|uniref:Lipoprotein n=1 Tax=Chitinophaga eiseniae TaxID=634771 RepID=A0A1T4SXV3_9BACT|nr:hypothetical protein [Chitinophaga eiseniae]SKA32959.1 hypothetical protein SAMN04488128_103744 [Chitinophaga eiseniae]